MNIRHCLKYLKNSLEKAENKKNRGVLIHNETVEKFIRENYNQNRRNNNSLFLEDVCLDSTYPHDVLIGKKKVRGFNFFSCVCFFSTDNKSA